MSTNYYWNPSPTGIHASFGQLHIGKSSGGWAFSFQGFMFVGSSAEKRSFEVSPGIRVILDTPALPPLILRSIDGWETLLRQPGSTIDNEYGEVISADEFLDMVRTRLHPVDGSWGPAERKMPLLNHFDELVKNERHYGPVDPDCDWKDGEGYAFTMSEFS